MKNRINGSGTIIPTTTQNGGVRYHNINTEWGGKIPQYKHRMGVGLYRVHIGRFKFIRLLGLLTGGSFSA